jgi:Zn-dependent protease with chaperone function
MLSITLDFTVPLLAGMASTFIVLWIYSLPLRRLPEDSHWSQIARHYHHLRIARTFAIIWITTAACASSYGRLTGRGDGWMLALVGLAAIIGCMTGSRWAARGLHLPPALRGGGAGTMLTGWLLFPGFPSILVLMALTLPIGLQPAAWIIAAVILMINLALVMGGSVWLLQLLGLLRPVDPTLEMIVRKLATEQQLPLRRVMQTDLPMANAFAFPWTRDIGFTSATLATLDESELSSIIAHELGHLRENLVTRWKRLTGLLSIVTIGLAPAALHDGQTLTALALFASYLLISRLCTWLHKRLEISADQHAHRSESGQGTYARALEKIHAASLIPAVLHPRHPYPSLYDRMTDAGVVPDFARPNPPGRMAPLIGGILATVIFFFLSEALHHTAEDVLDRWKSSGSTLGRNVAAPPPPIRSSSPSSTPSFPPPPFH